MEAVGRLAGGIAHDFNNLLTVITGRSRLLLGRLAPDDPLRRGVEIIDATAERAGLLTRQLLAFSRKQVLSPAVLDLNEVVTGVTDLLRRLIGETIDLDVRLAPSPGRVRVDRGQIEQVLVNLVVNARDAMPRGGRITIETSRVVPTAPRDGGPPGLAPGSSVRLAVTDTGTGMDAGTRARIFEPFFTTKEPGKGTGLGLATVYGIVTQSGGRLEVESEPGAGSAFTIFLPCVGEGADTPSAGSLAPERGHETVLVVEDETEVRALVHRVLEEHGYVVLGAGRSAEALRIVERHPGPIHLLVTDMVMPDMSGAALAERLAALRPQMAILYMSGYTDYGATTPEGRRPGIAFLQKPFTPEALAHQVRAVLDAAAVPAVG
jgi:CheY-like chemotaxis protein